MGLKSFLKQQGFIADKEEDKTKSGGQASAKEQQAAATVVPPTFFPLHTTAEKNISASADAAEAEPSFVTPLPQNKNTQDLPDPAFIKFFEEELAKANIPGPDYFEFRQLLLKTQQKMAAKGSAAPDVVLQAVLMSFEAQDISPAKLIEAARHYKDILQQKKDDFLKGAATEKNNQLQKRQSALQAHDENIKKIQDQLHQLELQKQQLEAALDKEKTQAEVDRSLGKEGIEKIEKAERLLSQAHQYIEASIDNDINKLQTV